MVRMLTSSSLLRRFNLLSLACLVLLGAVLARQQAEQIRDRALDQSGVTAQTIADVGLHAQIGVGDTLARGLTSAQRDRLDAVIRDGRADGELVRVKIWDRTGRVVYSDDPRATGRRFAVEDDLREAFAGERSAEVTDAEDEAEQATERGQGPLLEVYVPLRLSPGARPAGAFEMYLPYAPVARSIRRDVRRMLLLLAGGLLVTWLVLSRIVAQASRRLRRHADELEHQATHDALTGLPNRRLLTQRLAAMQGPPRSHPTTLLVIDLDDFRELGDTLGHAAGEQLLLGVGPRLAEAVPDAPCIAHLGGDQFAVVLSPGTDPRAARDASARIAARVLAPVTIGGVRLEVRATVGAATGFDGRDDDGGAALLHRAEVALGQAREAGLAFAVYDPDRDLGSKRRLELASELRAALARRELELHYQPKVAAATGEIVGAEALIRWPRPDGLLLPNAFIPLAVQAGLMTELTAFVLDEALARCAVWRGAGHDVGVAINLSAPNLLDTRLPADVAGALARHEVPPEHLQLEITEDVVVAETARAPQVVEELSALGVGVSLDDFGTGFSSLAHLRTLAVDELKIDRSFVMAMGRSEGDAAIVRATVDLARSLGKRVVAEGVEDPATMRRLADLGCDVIQGYLISRPLPAEDFDVWLRCARRLLSADLVTA